MKSIIKYYLFLTSLILGSCTSGENEINPEDSLPQNIFTDPRDGNVYKTVKIGNQHWFAENLRYMGDLSQIVSPQAWSSIKFDENLFIGQQAAWSYYENDPKNDSLYGKLYNWHAVRSNKICPPGWHVPTNYEWYVLREFLGGYLEAEIKLKATSGWSAINNDSTNQSGFTGRPGGERNREGIFKGLGNEGKWWSYFAESFGYLLYNVQGWSLSSNEAGFMNRNYDLSVGLSCRCIENVLAKPRQNTLTDVRDGNVYEIVKIGNQTWFAENLRFAGNIPDVVSNLAWRAIYNNGLLNDKPAWCHYFNDPNLDAVYGKLYNWYAVKTGTLCPPGWHIPTDEEWTTLSDFLGGKEIAGSKMKSVSGFVYFLSYPLSTNESGFTGLPGGKRDSQFLNFTSIENRGSWWSSTNQYGNTAESRSLDQRALLSSGSDHFSNGLSCRCVMN